jgi:hypothetical protein
MTGEEKVPSGELVERQEQVVQHYAGRLREAAAAGGRHVAKGDGTRKAYEILNECAMELEALTRRAMGGDADGSDVTH